MALRGAPGDPQRAGRVDQFDVEVVGKDAEAVAILAPLLQDVPAASIPLSPVTRLVGAAAALLGDREAALKYFERGLDWARNLCCRPEIALTRLEIAELLMSGSPDEQAEAQAHLDFAIEEFRTMKMQPSLERALRHKGLLHA